MIKAILIDDEPESLQVNVAMLKMFCPNVSILGAYTDPAEGLEALKNDKPDVVFLDIQMPGMTGFELLSRLPTIEFDLIFVTAYHEYALDAIKLSALDYVMKPLSPTELEEAVSRAEKKKEDRNIKAQVDILFKLLENQDKKNTSPDQRIVLPLSDSDFYLEIRNIVRIKADGGYSTFYLTNTKPLMLSKNIGLYEAPLDKFDIMRVHRSHIVNLHFVEKFRKTDGGFLVMKNGDEVPISPHLRDEIQRRLANL